jgi:hypothetical protein
MESLVAFVMLNFWTIFMIITMILIKRFRWGALALLAVQSAYGQIQPWTIMSIVSIIVFMEWYRWGETRRSIEVYIANKTQKLKKTENKQGEKDE